MLEKTQTSQAAPAAAARIYLDFPPALTADLLSGLIGQSIPTILANRSRAPHKLPPACLPPGTKQPVWLLADVLAWLASHREPPTPQPITVVASRRGSPTKVERAEATRLGITVRELRTRTAHAQKGGVA